MARKRCVCHFRRKRRGQSHHQRGAGIRREFIHNYSRVRRRETQRTSPTPQRRDADRGAPGAGWRQRAAGRAGPVPHGRQGGRALSAAPADRTFALPRELPAPRQQRNALRRHVWVLRRCFSTVPARRLVSGPSPSPCQVRARAVRWPGALRRKRERSSNVRRSRRRLNAAHSARHAGRRSKCGGTCA